tara:strand:+ start:947 stop:1450 length:504 start_codon:yes stop_codon:yes gene_type:complete
MKWLWIDYITTYEPNSRLVAIKNIPISENHMHHYTVDEKPIMPFSLLIEGMAQSAGILVGSVSRFKEKVILAKIRNATINSDVTSGDAVRFDASIEHIDQGGASTTGLIDRRIAGGDAWARIGEIDLMFSHIDKNMAGIDFPKENFVFSDNFKLVLEQAGLADLAET